ncbi:hypothetical protein WJX72_005593 [[Myrmecia] bisecta]|uniref:non-specific serine/threonine protein kinase n=1 Tax=[Myrmecia] bisecta TaxID=41462 RepID=A0AAW1QRW0_9CHLO
MLQLRLELSSEEQEDRNPLCSQPTDTPGPARPLWHTPSDLVDRKHQRPVRGAAEASPWNTPALLAGKRGMNAQQSEASLGRWEPQAATITRSRGSTPLPDGPSPGVGCSRFEAGSNQAQLYVFGTESGKPQADVLVILKPLNDGDADLFCVPFPGLFDEFPPPGPQNYAWSSDFSQGQDFVFISRNDTAYSSGVTSSGTVKFVCAANQQRPEDVVTDFCYVGANICDSDGHLIRLDMSRFNLACAFPTKYIGAFPRLQKLSMARNNLKGDFGQIAAALENITTLDTLDLSYNPNVAGNLAPATPTGGICKLANTSLEFLDLTLDSTFGTIPACLLSKGSQLRAIFLGVNNLTGTIPDVIPVGSNLSSLTLNTNVNLTGTLPRSFANATELVTLDLSSNGFSGPIPTAFGQLPRLISIRLTKNAMQGTVPDSLASSPVLREFIAAHNQLERLPAAWLNASKPQGAFRYLDVSSNRIQGAFPRTLAASPTTLYLLLGDNYFSGTLPDMPGDYQNLATLNISTNAFSGTLPASLATSGIFNESQLATRTSTGDLVLTAHILDASNNQMSGAIPDYLSASALPPDLGVSVVLKGNNWTCPTSGNFTWLGLECIPATGLTVASKENRTAEAAQLPPPASGLSSSVPVAVSSAGPPTASSSTSSGGLSGGAIAGIVIGSIVGVALLVALVTLAFQKCTNRGQGWEKQELEMNRAYNGQ